MTLQAGARVGPYEIVAPLGAGGMGEVYRARDTSLKRDVAIKVLPEAFAADPPRLSRFQREAELLAALNHPHIAAIYGLQPVGNTSAIVMELVDGETLAQRLGRSTTITDVLTIAQQIADALEAAHDKGIVHRDLKPANIAMTRNGAVKVLDFGLAKALEQDVDRETRLDGTRDGMILGTAAYMSPEQARGLVVDKRTDIWAFGCVLFEALAGRAPFAGATVTDTLAAILEREPDWSALPSTTPTAIQRLLHRCLEKDQRRRLHDIADARIEIEEALASGSSPSIETSVVRRDTPSARLSWTIAAIAVVAASTAVGALIWNNRAPRRVASPRIWRTALPTSSSEAFALSGGRSVAITPDGAHIVYIGNNDTQIFVRSLDRLDATVLATGAAPLNWVFLSPDGQWVAFEEGSTLRKVAITGGPVTPIAEVPSGTRGATWLPDDTIVFGSLTTGTGLRRVSASGGAVTMLTKPESSSERAHAWPEMIPGGRILFTIITTGGRDAAQVAVLDLATGKHTVLVRGGSHARYALSGHLVYVSGDTLRAMPFDQARLETRGEAATVLPRVIRSSEGSGDFDISPDGTLVYAASATVGAPSGSMVWVDRLGREEPLPAPERAYSQPRLSPDGKQIAIVIEGDSIDIWIWDIGRRTLTQLTSNREAEFNPVWMPDQRHVLFFSPGRERGLFWQSIDGIAQPERLGSGLPSGATPDGTRVLFSLGAMDVSMMTVAGSRTVETLVQTPANERNGVVSPDGRWLAYESDTTGRFEIYVRPFPKVGDAQRLISTAGGTRPVWATNGREIFYVALDGSVMAVSVETGSGGWSTGAPARVVGAQYMTLSSASGRTYDVSRDGQRFLVVKPAGNQSSAPQLILVQNWFDELKRLAPAGR